MADAIRQISVSDVIYRWWRRRTQDRSGERLNHVELTNSPLRNAVFGLNLALFLAADRRICRELVNNPSIMGDDHCRTIIN
jgi:hypothetical protein